jgi:hypothetical protein
MKTSKNRIRKKATRKRRMRQIYYTGIGCRADFIHTKEQFINVMTGQFPEHVWVRRKGDPPGIPQGKYKTNDVTGWMEFGNAHWV